MFMWRSSLWGFVLLIIGVLYLLDHLHLVPNIWTAGVLWPLVLVLVGLGGLKEFRRGRWPWWSMYFIVLGIGLSARNSHAVGWLDSITGWEMCWGLALVFAGLSMVLPRRFGFRAMVFHNISRAMRSKNGGTDVEWQEDSKGKWSKRRIEQSRRVIGDLSIGQHPWILKDMNLWNAIGDIRVNLATAHIEDGTYHIEVSGYIGDIRVLVPAGLAVDVSSYLKVGDVDIFGDKHSGIGRREVSYQDPEFETATKRVRIRVDLIIGDVLVQRV